MPIVNRAGATSLALSFPEDLKDARSVVSLTSIPPRFATLGPVLETLTAQGADAVVLTLPRTYRRFPGPTEAPPLPGGVTLLWSETDPGPALKLLGALAACPHARITACDDDTLYGDGWLSALEEAGTGRIATTGAGWSVTRLKRPGCAPPATDIAQGFSGLSITPAMFGPEVFNIPEVAWPVDDIWFSGHLAQRGIPIHAVPAARALCTPLDRPAALQSAQDLPDRATANAATALWFNDRYGIWPPQLL